MKKNNGFTMIELIVSMAIIMVVSVAGIVSFSSSSAKARDSRRMSDVEKIRVALEMFKQAYKFYPPSASNQPDDSHWSEFMPAWPSDPKSGWQYEYNRIDQYNYTVRARLETSSPSPLAGTCGDGEECNYQVQNP